MFLTKDNFCNLCVCRLMETDKIYNLVFYSFLFQILLVDTARVDMLVSSIKPFQSLNDQLIAPYSTRTNLLSVGISI